MMSLLHTHTPVKLPLYHIIYIYIYIITSMAHHRHPAFLSKLINKKYGVYNGSMYSNRSSPKNCPIAHATKVRNCMIASRHKGLAYRFARAYHEFVDLAIKNDGFTMVFHSYVNVYQRVEGTAMSFEPHHQLPSPQIPSGRWRPERAKPGYPPLRSSRMPSSNFCWSPPSAWVRMSGGSGMGYIWC